MNHTCVIDEQELDEFKENMLLDEECSDLALLFKMYADPTRLKILHVLFMKELCVCDIAYILNMSHSAISHQLSVLRTNRIIKARRVGKNMYYSLDDEHIQSIYNGGLEHIKER
jgi:DNA-binding transcriptional ArsR family regulator